MLINELPFEILVDVFLNYANLGIRNEQGVFHMTVVTRTEREELYSYISDAHKDAYGSRPHGRWETYRAMSIEELREEADRLSAAVAVAIEEEDRARNEAETRFERLVSLTIENGASDRETAIRWIIEGEGIAEDIEMQGMGYLCYRFGLRYSYFSEAA
jgi:hypothetical protein